MNEIEHDEPSKSQIKREAKEQADLGHALVKLPLSVLNTFDLPDDLFDAIKLAKSIKQNRGLKRQLQYVGKLMMQRDTEDIRKLYDAYFAQKNQVTNEFHECEEWRDKFLANDKEVFKNFLEQYPDTDRQHLRQLQRNAIDEAKRSKPPKYARLLFKYIREIVEP